MIVVLIGSFQSFQKVYFLRPPARSLKMGRGGHNPWWQEDGSKLISSYLGLDPNPNAGDEARPCAGDLALRMPVLDPL